MTLLLDSLGTIGEARKAVSHDTARGEAFAQAALRVKDRFDVESIEPHRVGRRMETITNKALADIVPRVANFLREQCGIENAGGKEGGTKVAILSQNRREAVFAELGVHESGATLVADYLDLPERKLAFFLHDSDTEIAFAENQQQVDRLLKIMRAPPMVRKVGSAQGDRFERADIKIRKIITFEPVEVAGPEASMFSTFDEVLKLSSAIPGSSHELDADSIATIVYTPAADGTSLGVMLSHGNLLANVRQAQQAGMFQEDSEIAAILPFQHSFGRLTMLSGLLTGAKLRIPSVTSPFTSRVEHQALSVVEDLKMISGNVIALVPGVLQGMMDQLKRQARTDSFVRRCLKAFTEEDGVAAPEVDSNGTRQSKRVFREFFARSVPVGMIRNGILNRLGFAKARQLIVGGAKLPLHLSQFFGKLSENPDFLLEGYGLTLASPVVASNRPGDNVPGSVGRPLADDIEVKLDGDELLVKGPNIGKGYYKRPRETARDFQEDGFARTHDSAVLDPITGRIAITGKTDEKIVLLNGKNFYPAEVEEILRNHPIVDQALVIGDNAERLGAIIALSEDAVREHAEQRDIDLGESLFGNLKGLRKLLRAEFEIIARRIRDEQATKLHKVVVASGPIYENLFGLPLTVGERKALQLKFQDDIEALYRSRRRKFRFAGMEDW